MGEMADYYDPDHSIRSPLDDDESEGLSDGPDLVFSTSPAPEGIDTDCMFLASGDRISVHISRRAINAQVARRAMSDDGRIAAIERDHVPVMMDPAYSETVICDVCLRGDEGDEVSAVWPCDTDIVLARLREVEQERDALIADWNVEHPRRLDAEVERDAARADADRLAEALRGQREVTHPLCFCAYVPRPIRDTDHLGYCVAARAALAAHEAAK